MRWLVVLLLIGCTHVPPQPPPDVLSDCAMACERLRYLECEAAQPTPDGHTCLEMCETTEATGYTTTHPECIAMASDCEDADRLSQEGCR